MPSTRAALPLVVLVVLVALAGCAGSGGSDSTATPTDRTTDRAPESGTGASTGASTDPSADGVAGTATPARSGPHAFVFASHTGGSFNATVTVSKGGETLFERSIASTTNVTYRNLTTLDGAGPYNVTVNTTIPFGKADTIDERFQVDAAPGTATVLAVSYTGVDTETFALPRQPVDHPLGARGKNFRESGVEVNATVEVWYRGERIGTDGVYLNDNKLRRGVQLRRTGVYAVAVEVDGERTRELVVLEDPAKTLYVQFSNPDGRVEWIGTTEPTEWS